ncbi:MAG TPA: hypothetical protein VK778_05525 [Solirubrobacteraceae bacterium]|jgi:hypothetical protein|nr:hypothetical protein [Solirubrobacteraceae bacterium]
MRPSLLHPLGEPRHARRRRRGRATRVADPAREPISETISGACDPAAQRVREAGGPIDQASYSCQCGCLFSADVSTTVTCPHCGTDQAW